MVGDVASPAELSQLFPTFKNESAQARRPGILDAFIKAGQRKVVPDAPQVMKDLLTALLSGDGQNADLAARGAVLAGLWKQEPLRPRLEEIASGDNTPPRSGDSAIKGLGCASAVSPPRSSFRPWPPVTRPSAPAPRVVRPV